MKRLLAALAIVALGATLATPALAGHRDRYRGHGRHTHPHLHGRVCRVVHVAPRRAVSFGFATPLFGGFYAGPVAYGPAPVFYGEPVWIPGHFVHRDGVRFFIQGHWSR